MGHNPTHIMNEAVRLIRKRGGFVPFIRDAGLGGVAFALFAQIITAIDGFGTVAVGVPKAFGLGFIMLIEVFFQGLADVFGAGTAASVRSFTDGVAALLGPFAQPAAAGTILMTLAVFVWVINRQSITPLAFIRDVNN